MKLNIGELTAGPTSQEGLFMQLQNDLMSPNANEKIPKFDDLEISKHHAEITRDDKEVAFSILMGDNIPAEEAMLQKMYSPEELEELAISTEDLVG